MESDRQDLIRRAESQFSPAKQKLLELRLQGKAPGASRQLILPRSPDARLRLSSAQEQLWVIHIADPDSAAYNVPAFVRIAGQLDASCLEAALNALRARHEILRTCYPAVDGRATALIQRYSPSSLCIVDLSRTPREHAERKAAILARSYAMQPFDLQKGPVFRTILVRLATDESLLLLAVHHIACDGWSLGLLFRDLDELYRAVRESRLPHLQPLFIQYADYALWQQERLIRGELEVGLSYWTQLLDGAPAVLELPTDRARPAVLSSRGSTLGFQLPPDLSDRFRALAQHHNATLFMALLAAFESLLQRYTGSSDFLVGSMLANRAVLETADLIGPFNNTCVFRARLRPSDSFLQVLGQVRIQSLAAQDHADTPFPQLVERLAPRRDASRSALFQVMFCMDQTVNLEAGFGDVVISPYGSPTASAQFDLVLDCSDNHSGIRGVFTYSTDLFDSPTIDRLASNFRQLLQSIVEFPTGSLRRIMFLDPAEQQLLLGWSSSQGPSFAPGSLEENLEHGARLVPNAPAVIGATCTLTYAELNAKACSVAGRLLKYGLGTESIVAILADRDINLAVAVRAVWMCGAAFTVLEPAQPLERLLYLLANSGTTAVLTNCRRHPLLEQLVIPIIFVDNALPTSLPVPSDFMPGSSVACLTFTSGSSGCPTAVVVTRDALARYAEHMAVAMDLRPGDRVLQFASPGFDVFLEELLPAWFAGAAVVFDPWPGPPDFDDLLNSLNRYRITHLELPAAYWRRWVQFLVRTRARLPQSFRLLLIGCEAPTEETLELWRPFGVPILHVFGATETTITTNTFAFPSAQSLDRPRLPIGRPFGPAQVYVLDGELAISPVGVPGELHVGGPALSRGYFAEPALTAERFLPDPFSGVPGSRLFKTGDLVRVLPDGNLEFLGRLDQQINLNGLRIEPGEVETALRRHPGVQDAAIFIQPGDRCVAGHLLAAIVTAADSEAPDSTELKTFLRRFLPAYMIPARFVWPATLPLTERGKLDRRALLTLFNSAPAEVVPPTGLANDLEQRLAALWAESLNLERPGRGENFFELGGDSILAIQVATRARENGIALSASEFFRYQTIAEQAEAVQSREYLSGPPWTPGQRQLRALLRPGTPWAQIRFAMVPGLSPQALRDSLDELTRRHDALTLITETAGGCLVSSSPLVRFTVEETSLSLTINAHPWALDRFSWPILFSELSGTVVDPATPMPYRSAVLNLLRHIPAAFALPERSFSVPVLQESLDLLFLDASEQTIDVSTLCDAAEAYRTGITEILLAAFAYAYCEKMGKTVCPIALVLNLRELPTLEVSLSRTIGPFSLDWPLELHLADDASDPIALVRAVRDQVRQARMRPIMPSVSVAARLGFYGDWTVACRPGRVVQPPDAITLLRSLAFAERPDLPVLDAILFEGHLRVCWYFPRKNCSEVTLAQALHRSLLRIVERRNGARASVPVPEDFPEARITQQDLDYLFSGGNSHES